jgi:hypothetical protein
MLVQLIAAIIAGIAGFFVLRMLGGRSSPPPGQPFQFTPAFGQSGASVTTPPGGTGAGSGGCHARFPDGSVIPIDCPPDEYHNPLGIQPGGGIKNPLAGILAQPPPPPPSSSPQTRSGAGHF